MEHLYILLKIRCPRSFITGGIRKRNESSLQRDIHSFSYISEMFCTSFQVYSVILLVIYAVLLLFTFERDGNSLNSSVFLLFFILENSVVTLHIRFICIVIKNCYTTSYKDPSVADLFSILLLQACG